MKKEKALVKFEERNNLYESIITILGMLMILGITVLLWLFIVWLFIKLAGMVA